MNTSADGDAAPSRYYAGGSGRQDPTMICHCTLWPKCAAKNNGDGLALIGDAKDALTAKQAEP